MYDMYSNSEAHASYTTRPQDPLHTETRTHDGNPSRQQRRRMTVSIDGCRVRWQQQQQQPATSGRVLNTRSCPPARPRFELLFCFFSSFSRCKLGWKARLHNQPVFQFRTVSTDSKTTTTATTKPRKSATHPNSVRVSFGFNNPPCQGLHPPTGLRIEMKKKFSAE
ncbi:hypothetical protein EX30DRAFT_121176 [Ascodesmis nigricans]|uniref:Uncharacterized protein n=1 Tax=Ascodesmis nigricans TaxID=341454 RepID=A0A4S2MPA3_9PEZI|nr:hypothetical protein EX30DRAFT_121176 [Ascodesmis nigricans]